MTVLVMTPLFSGGLHPSHVKGVVDAVQFYEDAEWDFAKGYFIDRARNIMAKKAMDGGYSHILMVDSDIVIPADCIETMLSPAADIVLGFYKRKVDSGDIYEMFHEGPGFKTFSQRDLDKAPDRIQVRGGGFGCAMVNVNVFKKLSFPWFKLEQYADGRILSEDLYFSRLAQGMGIETYADSRVICDHIGEKLW